jgi:hypothetical protein
MKTSLLDDSLTMREDPQAPYAGFDAICAENREAFRGTGWTPDRSGHLGRQHARDERLSHPRTARAPMHSCCSRPTTGQTLA